jgi:hypothetical protein
MLVLFRVSIDAVLAGVIFFLESSNEARAHKAARKGSGCELKQEVVDTEASICLFVYGFLVYTYDWYKKDAKEVQVKALRTIWPNLMTLSKYKEV